MYSYKVVTMGSLATEVSLLLGRATNESGMKMSSITARVELHCCVTKLNQTLLTSCSETSRRAHSTNNNPLHE